MRGRRLAAALALPLVLLAAACQRPGEPGYDGDDGAVGGAGNQPAQEDGAPNVEQ